jgi:hypothetical protein
MVIVYLAATAVVRADTISYADAVTTLAKDCGADIRKLCSGLNLGNGRITGCLQQNAAKVSSTCTSTLTSVFSSIRQREDAQTAYFDVCRRDIAQHCRGVKGDGYQLSCLVKAERIVSSKCNQAITDAGWR